MRRYAYGGERKAEVHAEAEVRGSIGAMSGYARPSRLTDALRILARAPRAVLAGGTDFYPSRVAQALHAEILDITALRELRGIAAKRGHWRIGAATTWSEVI